MGTRHSMNDVGSQPSRASVAVVWALPGGHAAHALTELATVHDRVFRRHVGDVLPEGGVLTGTDA
jgi:hypothetical protein